MLLLFVFLGLPVVVDGSNEIELYFKKKSGHPLIAVNGEVVLRQGRGPSEMELGVWDYDAWSQSITISGRTTWGTYYLNTGEFEKHRVSHEKRVRGRWGKYRIVLWRDFAVDRRIDHSRVTLESEADESILIARQSQLQTSMHFYTHFEAEKTCLLVLDNLHRSIGFLPLVNGEVRTYYEQDKHIHTPVDMLTFPMPHKLRKNAIKLACNVPPSGRLHLIKGVELHPGLFVFQDNQGTAYLYDLHNPSGFDLGFFAFEGLMVGSKDGQMLYWDHKSKSIKALDPLSKARGQHQLALH